MDELVIVFVVALILTLVLCIGLISVVYRLYEYWKVKRELEDIQKRCEPYMHRVIIGMNREMLVSKSLEALKGSPTKSDDETSTEQSIKSIKSTKTVDIDQGKTGLSYLEPKTKTNDTKQSKTSPKRVPKTSPKSSKSADVKPSPSGTPVEKKSSSGSSKEASLRSDSKKTEDNSKKSK